jgi:hypothetical protein
MCVLLRAFSVLNGDLVTGESTAVSYISGKHRILMFQFNRHLQGEFDVSNRSDCGPAERSQGPLLLHTWCE